MINKIKLLAIVFFLGIFLMNHGKAFGQSCFTTGVPPTAAYATAGDGNYKDKILWLTWGTTQASEIASYPYGRHLVQLIDGSVSRASIDKGNGRFLCIEAKISNVKGDGITNTSQNAGQIMNWDAERNIVKTGWVINSYAPGNYSGDVLDDMYRIGGTGVANKLISGIRNSRAGSTVSFTLTCRATLNGVPIKLAGLVLADAESMASTEGREFISAEGDGVWTIIDVKKNIGAGDYKVLKTSNSSGTQSLKFGPGTDNVTGAVAAMIFNQTAYSGSVQEVSFQVTLKGGGGTAVAIGLIPTSLDGGDAPESYGNPLHIIDDLIPKSDGVTVGNSVNINRNNYTVGGLGTPTTGYLGTVYPDGDISTNYSINADGDDNTGTAGINEEDAWPDKYKRFSYKLYYKPGDQIEASIRYVPEAGKPGFIYGWIDFNLNGKFDHEELAKVQTSGVSGAKTATLKWAVPQKRIIGSTYVRLRYVYDSAQEITDLVKLQELAESSIVTNGEVEDHRIYILGPSRTNPMLPSKAKK